MLHLGEALPFTYFFSNYGATGISFLNFPVWYISVLLFVSIIFYFIVSRHKDLFCNLLLPVIIVLVYRYFYHYCDSINVAEYEGILMNGFYLRGIGAMACGCLIYCLIQKLSKYTFTKGFFICMRILEFGFMIGMIGISYFWPDSNILKYVIFLSIIIPYSIFTKWIVDFGVNKAKKLVKSFVKE